MGEHLQRNPAAALVLGCVDFSHAASPEEALDAVRSELLTLGDHPTAGEVRMSPS
jgi:hypothetical protein